jgi:hypothetical protein
MQVLGFMGSLSARLPLEPTLQRFIHGSSALGRLLLLGGHGAQNRLTTAWGPQGPYRVKVGLGGIALVAD